MTTSVTTAEQHFHYYILIVFMRTFCSRVIQIKVFEKYWEGFNSKDEGITKRDAETLFKKICCCKYFFEIIFLKIFVKTIFFTHTVKGEEGERLIMPPNTY